MGHCFSCGRAIREWETGFTATGLCEDCQFEAEEQARLDNEATFSVCEDCGCHFEGDGRICASCGDERDYKHGVGYWDDPNGGGPVSF